MQYDYMYYTDETKAPNGYTDYEKIDIKDDFMFCTVMKNSELCRKFLLTYMASGEVTDEYTADLNSEVHNLRYNEEWRVAHMTFEEKLNETYEDGVEAGITKGKAIGLEEGLSKGKADAKQRMSALVKLLIANNRQSDLLNLSENADKLLEEYKEEIDIALNNSPGIYKIQ